MKAQVVAVLNGNRALEPARGEVGFFSKEEVLLEEVKVHRQSDHGCGQTGLSGLCGVRHLPRAVCEYSDVLQVTDQVRRQAANVSLY